MEHRDVAESEGSRELFASSLHVHRVGFTGGGDHHDRGVESARLVDEGLDDRRSQHPSANHNQATVRRSDFGGALSHQDQRNQAGERHGCQISRALWIETRSGWFAIITGTHLDGTLSLVAGFDRYDRQGFEAHMYPTEAG